MKVIIVGAGKLGFKIAESLVDENIDVTIIEEDINLIEKISESLDILTINGSGIDINVLENAKVAECDLLIATTKEDEVNSLICLFAKKLGCKQTIARLRNPEYSKQKEIVQKELGIDYIINPELITAKYMERYLLEDYSFNVGSFASKKVAVLNFNIENNPYFVNKKITELKNFNNYLIAAIYRSGELIIPHGSTLLLENDIIHIITKKDNIALFTENFQSKSNSNTKKLEKIMIVGGGRTSYYLSKLLENKDIDITIIEEDEKRCQELAQSLNNTLIIHGDGTDIHLLEDENLNEMDAFVGLSGLDEQNILLALLAKQSGVKKAIAKISRDNYTKLVNSLEVDTSFNPIHLTAAKILKFIRGGKVSSVSLLLGGDGEVNEIIVGNNKNITNKPLSELKLPKGILIGAIVHNDEVIIPNGNSIIYPNDRIVVFSLTKDIKTLQMFFKEEQGELISEIKKRFKNHW